MKKLQSGKWGLRIKGGDTSIAALMALRKEEHPKYDQANKGIAGLHKNFHPTKGFGYRSRRGKRSNGTKIR